MEVCVKYLMKVQSFSINANLDANKQLRCNVDVNDDDDYLRDETLLMDHELHGLHEFTHYFARVLPPG